MMALVGFTRLCNSGRSWTGFLRIIGNSDGDDGGDDDDGGDGDGDDDDDGYRVQTKLEAISRVWHLPQPSQQLLSMRRRMIWRMLLLIAHFILKTGL